MKVYGNYLPDDAPDSLRVMADELASRSSAPTFPPKPLLTDANAADRCVHGTHPPAICEHCQRQATTRAAPSEGPAVDLDEALKRVDVSGLFDDPPALPVPAQEAEAERLLRLRRAERLHD